jgi:hypothetical protein
MVKPETKIHLVLTLCTLGMWLPFWACIAFINAVWPKKKPQAPATAGVAGPPAVSRQQYDLAYRNWYYGQYLPWAQAHNRYVDVPPRQRGSPTDN